MDKRIYIINNRWTTKSIYTAIRMACKLYTTTHQEITVIEAVWVEPYEDAYDDLYGEVIKFTAGGYYEDAYRIMHISADGIVDDEQIAL